MSKLICSLQVSMKCLAMQWRSKVHSENSPASADNVCVHAPPPSLGFSWTLLLHFLLLNFFIYSYRLQRMWTLYKMGWGQLVVARVCFICLITQRSSFANAAKNLAITTKSLGLYAWTRLHLNTGTVLWQCCVDEFCQCFCNAADSHLHQPHIFYDKGWRSKNYS